MRVYTKLYDALVRPIIDYGAAVWGYRSMSPINAVQNRAMRFYLGVSKCTPNAAVHGELAWMTPKEQQWVSITRQWCRLINMDSDRQTKKIFKWASEVNCKNWTFFARRQFAELDLNYLIDTTPLDIRHGVSLVRGRLQENVISDWNTQLHREQALRGNGLNKLRTYRLFKTEYRCEPYLSQVIPWRHRRVLAQFRCGTAPLRLETGRYEKLNISERTCYHCTDCVEDELHVINICPVYQELRNELYSECASVNGNFYSLSDVDKLCFILADAAISKVSARILFLVMELRKRFLYSSL